LQHYASVVEYIPQLLEKVVGAVEHTPQLLQHSLFVPPKGWWTNYTKEKNLNFC
jgi:hypothetical protein